MKEKLAALISASEQIVIGKKDRTKLAICCLLSGGHLLVEDLPGLGKTTFAKFLSQAFGLGFGRIQFTSDLLPSDILGIHIFDQKDGKFNFHPGPIFTQFLLADELNRGSAKTQSALLEAMEENKITLDKKVYHLEQPFFVVATQNPRQQVGTNPLPESQLDRFTMKIDMGFPDPKDEKLILLGRDIQEKLSKIKAFFTPTECIELKSYIEENIYVSEAIAELVLQLLNISRSKRESLLSPRAGRALVKASKVLAYLEDRKFVIPEDIKYLAPFVLGHRLSQNGVVFERQQILNILEQLKIDL